MEQKSICFGRLGILLILVLLLTAGAYAIAPTITLTGSNPQTIEFGDSYTELGATATDENGNDISPSIVIDSTAVNATTLGVYQVTYDVSDSDGTPADQVVREVDVVDTTIPVITINGASPVTVQVDTPYADEGATALDNYDGDLTASIATTNPVDTSIIGAYTVTYDVSDSSGNAAAQVLKTVNVVDTVAPTIVLTGSNSLTIEVGANYAELGAVATDNHDANKPATVSGTVDTNIVGTYTVLYDATDSAGNPAVQATRTVNVVDTTPPVITLLGSNPQQIQAGTVYAESGATASDNYDGNITANIIIDATAIDANHTGTYLVTYNVTDAQGNAATQATRTIVVVDTNAPVITLKGDNPQTITVGNAYVELGATAIDNVDGNLDANIHIDASAVNTSSVGTYTVTYDVNDSNNNAAIRQTRTVNVVSSSTPTPSGNGGGSGGGGGGGAPAPAKKTDTNATAQKSADQNKSTSSNTGTNNNSNTITQTITPTNSATASTATQATEPISGATGLFGLATPQVGIFAGMLALVAAIVAVLLFTREKEL